MSCSGQLKSICQFSEKGRDLPRRFFQAETPSRILAVSSLAWTRLDTDKTSRRRGSGSRLVSSGRLPLHCLSPSYQLDRKKATGSGELLLHFVNVFGVLEISINNNRPYPITLFLPLNPPTLTALYLESDESDRPRKKHQIFVFSKCRPCYFLPVCFKLVTLDLGGTLSVK